MYQKNLCDYISQRLWKSLGLSKIDNYYFVSCINTDVQNEILILILITEKLNNQYRLGMKQKNNL